MSSSVVWVVMIAIVSTVLDSVMQVINETSLLLEMVIIRVNISVTVHIDTVHICLHDLLVLHQVLALVRKHIRVPHLEVLCKTNCRFWCVESTTMSHCSNLRVNICGISLNVIIGVTQTVVNRSIRREEGLTLSMLDGGKGALSASETMASCSTVSIGTWTAKCVVNWSHE
jgi:hypothetical protein